MLLMHNCSQSPFLVEHSLVSSEKELQLYYPKRIKLVIFLLMHFLLLIVCIQSRTIRKHSLALDEISLNDLQSYQWCFNDFVPMWYQ